MFVDWKDAAMCFVFAAGPPAIGLLSQKSAPAGGHFETFRVIGSKADACISKRVDRCVAAGGCHYQIKSAFKIWWANSSSTMAATYGTVDV